MITVRTEHTESNRPQATVSSRRGFTLIELMTVIGIIALLLLIGAPAAVSILNSIKVKASRVILAQVDAGLKAYKTDFEAYPPAGGNGGATICRLLTGYAPDQPTDDPDRTPMSPKGTSANSGSYSFADDDGQEGFGFRLAPKGRVFGPYGGTEDLRSSGGDSARFVDKFGQPILYYLYDFGARGFISSQNTDGPSITTYATNSSDTGGLYRTDYLLITCGPNGEWDTPSKGDSDDITNFKED